MQDRLSNEFCFVRLLIPLERDFLYLFNSIAMNKTIIGTTLGILVLGGLIWIARPNEQSMSASTIMDNSGPFSVEETARFDFGRISMAQGIVNHRFNIKNTSGVPITIGKMYTSCMCTTASLIIKSTRFGPVGMPGHGAVPSLNQTINPNEEAVVEVVFDPAAHGPAGVGRIQRTVTLENTSGTPVELVFSAIVTP